MSERTRQNRQRKPGVASVNRPARFDRRVEHRRVRRAAQVELSQLLEPEDHALPLPVHTSAKADPADRPDRQITRRRFKVWKTKDWKRRSAMRAERAASYRALLKSD
ncbi:MAG: hypothetical protein ACR2QK_04000 [Acidimicrobiales bacterium]